MFKNRKFRFEDHGTFPNTPKPHPTPEPVIHHQPDGETHGDPQKKDPVERLKVEPKSELKTEPQPETIPPIRKANSEPATENILPSGTTKTPPAPMKFPHRPFSLLCPKCGATDRFSIRAPEKGKGKTSDKPQGTSGETESIFCDKCHSLLQPGTHYVGGVDYIRHQLALPSEKIHPSDTDSPCYACGSRSWWISTAGKRVCGICHPPARPEVVSIWINENLLKYPHTVNCN